MSTVRWSARRGLLRNGLAALILILSALAAGTGSVFAAPAAAGPEVVGAVYVQTNAAAGNAVQVFPRDSDGGLGSPASFSTGGKGSGTGLGSQGALVFSDDRRWLFVVNAGSSDISAFAITPGGVRLVGQTPSGGAKPLSLTVHGPWLYVLNGGDPGNITGFRIGLGGSLIPLAGSTRDLSNDGQGAAPGPAEVQFSPAGNLLAVTEKGTNQIDLYPVDLAGRAGSRHTFPSSGATPFGFAFDWRGVLVVSEAAGGQAGQASVSSYAAFPWAALSPISPAVPDTQTAACWLAIGGPRGYAYTTNAGSGSISSYRIGVDGRLTLVNAQAGLTGAGSHPLDMAFSRDGRFLYNIDAATKTIHTFRVNLDGGLTFLGDTSAGTSVSEGIAAR
jgi:6-phosphogluconolactonase